MFFLSKFLPLFVLPLGISIFLLVAGIVTKRRKLLVLSAVLLWAASMPLTAGWLTRWVEGYTVRQPVASAPAADVIVVLSTGRFIAPGAERFSEWTDADRFFGGVDLFKAGKAPLLLFTGGIVSSNPKIALEGEVLKSHAIALGVPHDRILTTGLVLNTAEEAVAVAALLRERGQPNAHIVLVTSAFHVPRARRLFERRGLTVSPFLVDFQSRATGISVLNLMPSTAALDNSQFAIRELYGRAYYRLLDALQ